MSFSSQRAVHCFGDQFWYCLLIRCIKTAALKRQGFEDSESNATELKASKRPYVDAYKHEKGQGSDEY